MTVVICIKNENSISIVLANEIDFSRVSKVARVGEERISLGNEFHRQGAK